MSTKYIFLWAAISFAVGILCEETWGGEVPVLSLLGLVAGSFILLCCGYYKNHRNAALVGGVLFLCLLGAARLFVADVVWQHQSHWLTGASGTYVGTVMAPPLVQDGPGGYARYLVDLSSVRYEDGAEQPARGTAYAYDTHPAESFRVGDRISMEGKLSPIRIYGNPGKLDLAGRYQSLRLIGRIYPDEDALTSTFSYIEDSGDYRVERWAQTWKQKLSRTFGVYMDPSRLAVLMSLLFGGQYNEIPPSIMNSFSATGIVHILSVSGSHVALLFGFLYLLGKWLHFPKRLVLILSMGLVIFYALLSGLVPPVIRSVLMGLLAAGGVFLERERVGLNLFGAAIFVMLVVDPLYLFDVSFQLSAGASAGILLFYKPLLSFLGTWRRLPRFVAEGIALSTSAQVLTVPIILYDFHVFPLYFIPANLFITPLLEWAIIAGLLAALLSFVFAPLMAGILYVADYLLFFGIHGNGWLAVRPAASLGTGGMTVWQSAAWYGLVGLVYFHTKLQEIKWHLRAALGMEGLLLAVCTVLYIAAPKVVVYVPDLGLDRGAILVNGEHTILYYKAGPLPGYTAQWEWNSILGYEGIFSADLLLLNLEDAKEPIPLTMTCNVKDIRVTGGSPQKLASALVHDTKADVKTMSRGKLSLGDMELSTNGSSWLVTEGDRGVYLSGRRLLRNASFPEHMLWLAGGNGWKEAFTDKDLERVHPEALFYAGGRGQAAGEDKELPALYDIPLGDVTADGMQTAVYRDGWKIQ